MQFIPCKIRRQFKLVFIADYLSNPLPVLRHFTKRSHIKHVKFMPVRVGKHKSIIALSKLFGF